MLSARHSVSGTKGSLMGKRAKLEAKGKTQGRKPDFAPSSKKRLTIKMVSDTEHRLVTNAEYLFYRFRAEYAF